MKTVEKIKWGKRKREEEGGRRERERERKEDNCYAVLESRPVRVHVGGHLRLILLFQN